MANWDIDLADCKSILKTAAGSAKGYETNLTAVGEAFVGAVDSLKHSELVVAGLDVFLNDVVAPDIKALSGYTNSALQGTNDAIVFYQVGDTDMAGEAQRSTAEVDYPADLPGKARRVSKAAGLTGGS